MRISDWSSDVCSSDLRAACFLIARLDGLDDAAPASLLLADALVDEHVRVHRGTDREHEARDAGQRQRRPEYGHDPLDDEEVQRTRDIGVSSEEDRRVGTGCVRPCQYGGTPAPYKK